MMEEIFGGMIYTLQCIGIAVAGIAAIALVWVVIFLLSSGLVSPSHFRKYFKEEPNWWDFGLSLSSAAITACIGSFVAAVVKEDAYGDMGAAIVWLIIIGVFHTLFIVKTRKYHDN
ncbi:hypothetical protein FACS189431_5480 [Alphaproteobacteria bacterium]|nr:hypothetical protein FACS189431_5480 [Alphaproteobacteria bacterium]